MSEFLTWHAPSRNASTHTRWTGRSLSCPESEPIENQPSGMCKSSGSIRFALQSTLPASDMAVAPGRNGDFTKLARALLQARVAQFLNMPFREGFMLNLRSILRGAHMHSLGKPCGYTVSVVKNSAMKNGGNSSTLVDMLCQRCPRCRRGKYSAIPFSAVSPGCVSSVRFAALNFSGKKVTSWARCTSASASPLWSSH